VRCVNERAVHARSVGDVPLTAAKGVWAETVTKVTFITTAENKGG
jgi:hypothetical protein